jgi:hypothetical protein
MDNEICEARVGSSRHAAWVLHVIRFDLDALPATPRNRRAIIIGGSIATPSGIAGGLDKCGAGTVDIGVIVYAENATGSLHDVYRHDLLGPRRHY